MRLTGRSREGAWIEISLRYVNPVLPTVAPARERGLKCDYSYRCETFQRRSRKGAWIEIQLLNLQQVQVLVAPARERGLKL